MALSMWYSLCGIFLCFTVLPIAQAQTPTKPVWPDQFIATFGLNVNDSGIKNESSTFYSNWQIKAQLIDYPTQCIAFNDAATKQACKIWFLPAGAYIQIPEQNICCLWFPGVGAVPPDFLAPFNYSGVIENVPDQYGALHSCYRWDGDGFAYWTEVKTGFDIQFRDGPGDTFWNFGTLTDAPQAPSIFALPSGCGGSCPSSISQVAGLLEMTYFHSF